MVVSHKIEDPRKPPKPKVEDKPQRGKIVTQKEGASAIIPLEDTKFRKDLRVKVLEARDQVVESRWDLAGHLFKVKDETVYIHWGYKSFEEYLMVEVKLTERTGDWLIEMYDVFANQLKIDEDTKKKIKQLGWTKAKSLSRLKKKKVLNKNNISKWISIADKSSAMELDNQIRAAIQKKTGEGEEVEPMKNKTFRLAPEQMEIVDNAIEMASKVLESEKPGHCISMVCQDFVATNMFQKRKDRSNMDHYLNKIAAILGVRLIAMDIESKKIVHNSKLFEKLAKKIKRE